MKLNSISLAFAGPYRHLEAPFLAHYFRSTLRQVRFALLAAAIFYGGYSFIEIITIDTRITWFWIIRWGIACPCILGLLWFTFSLYFFRYSQLTLCAGILVCGLAMIAMSLLAPLEHQYVYLCGFVQIFFYIYTFLKIRFIWASAVSWVLLIIYMICAISLDRIPQDHLISIISFLIGTNLMGMLACYYMEYFTRHNFFLSRQLETKKRRLALANQFLEERVAKRTAELLHINDLLAEEIEDRKSKQIALRESETRYRRMVDNVTDYICVHDLNGKIIEVNSQMIKGLGYSYTELLSLNLKQLVVSEQKTAFEKYILEIGKKGNAVGMLTLITKHGRPRLIEYSNVLAGHNSNGNVVYCLARDITEHKHAEKALAESQAQFKNIFETAAAGMMIVHTQSNTIVEVNPAAAQMIGSQSEQLKGIDFDNIIRSVDEETAENIFNASEDPKECILVTFKKDNLPILKTMRSMEFNGESHWIVSFINISQIKEAETEKRELALRLNQFQHLEAIGTLAGGIAHDFNNILYGITGYTELALDDAPKNTILEANLKEIIIGSQRAKDLISQILTFSRQSKSEKKPIQTAPLIKEALKLLRATIPSTVEIQIDTASEVDMVQADPIQLHQVVINLCTNAAHAMEPQGGLLHVRLENVHVTEDEITEIDTLPSGDYVRLIVSDNGRGMDKEVIKRIFEPFFTTKAQGKGTGMGLSMVHGIVKSHHGAIRVTSEPGKGATFEVFLPAVEPSVESYKIIAEEIVPGTERILLVDDEQSIIKMGQRLLTKLGYQVTACLSGLEALKLFRQDPQGFDLVITDLTMPQMTGIKLAQHILHTRPKLPIIICTGYADQISDKQITELGIRELIIKPIMRRELAGTIRRALSYT